VRPRAHTSVPQQPRLDRQRQALLALVQMRQQDLEPCSELPTDLRWYAHAAHTTPITHENQKRHVISLRLPLDPAALPCGTSHNRDDGPLEPGVGVGDHQLHPGEPSGLQRAEEGGPERPVLAVADVHAQHLAAAITTHAGGHHHGLGDDPPVDPGLAVGRIDKDVGEALAGQRSVPEGADLAIESAQIRLTSLLLLPLSAPKARTRSSTLRGETPCKYASITTANSA
jgi:hypothetical protein